ncbi:DNA alkylation repair protein [Variovorax sp. J22G21]|uniref:DNA alkylation repair protein n=1 Tax=Variovorax fucosicus TaxID=3053517 RepID=UPI002575E4FF|nr:MULTISPECIES: DNA alkylation repair protein [unclassified Variovorax]MDM0039936.1 DNA alkylation repair protein [Variovorax sp. J22R193]MDM0061309.1 DNA alkylation repair protein [Variovorax sp. J22G21]
MAGSIEHLKTRKGAFRIALIPPEVLQALNDGLLETVNLNEFLALELPRLARSVAGQIGIDAAHERLEDTLAMLASFKPMKRHDHVARAFYDIVALHPERDAIAHRIATHPSDAARCWAAQWITLSGLELPRQLQAVRRFAADPHFGVREIAWMAVRDAVIASLDEALELLQPWVRDADPNIRRFASELTRPRGVWCAQIEALKAEPWLALPLLEPLQADGSRYVQNSVANWLNDASKTQGEWVESVAARWLAASDAPATRYIVRRALRTLSKA